MVGMKREAVDGVNDDGNAGSVSGEPAEDAGL